MQTLERTGYGSRFNNLQYDERRIKKSAKNESGVEKRRNEIGFYRYLLENDNGFPIPFFYHIGNTDYIMKYYRDYQPLYKVYPDSTQIEKDILLNKVFKHLHTLHRSEIHRVSKETIQRDLEIETCDKILTRFKEVADVLEPYFHIQSVNGLQLQSFDTIMKKIQSKIYEYISSTEDFIYTPIHGDCQFNNILYKKQTGDMIFIDPRGYFGNSLLLGMPEYDLAKVYFALSGYDVFDNMSIDSLQIDGDDLTLPKICLEEFFLQGKTIIPYLVVSIWLGNPHCFKENSYKAAFSYYYGLYLGTLL